jgi:hypothetical protein
MAAETETAPATLEAPTPPPAAAAPAKKSAKANDAKKDTKGGKDTKGAKEAKGAKGGKGAKKGAKDTDGADADAGGPSVAAHPRAARAVAQAKGWGGLAGFVLGGYLSLPTNTIAAAGLRALLAGVVCYMAAWAGAVFLWRRLVMLELKGREHQLLAAAHAAGARRELPAGTSEWPGAPPERPGVRAAS